MSTTRVNSNPLVTVSKIQKLFDAASASAEQKHELMELLREHSALSILNFRINQLRHEWADEAGDNHIIACLSSLSNNDVVVDGLVELAEAQVFAGQHVGK